MRISIGEMSKLHNISIHTLRYYDKIALLKPSEVDANSNYRYYDESDCHRLSKIKVLKSIGLSLNKINFLLEGNIKEVEESFQKIRENTLGKIHNLNEIVYYLDEQLRQIEELKSGNYYIEPKIVTLPKREGYIIKVSESNSLVDRIEAIVDFEKKNNTNADVFFRPSRLMHIKLDGERYLHNYLALKRDTRYGDLKNLYILDAGSYGVIDHIGHHKNINKSYNKLLNYINQKSLEIQNKAIEILVVSSNLTDNVTEWRTQIQIPIKNKE